jgi:hypothetical protein
MKSTLSAAAAICLLAGLAHAEPLAEPNTTIVPKSPPRPPIEFWEPTPPPPIEPHTIFSPTPIYPPSPPQPSAVKTIRVTPSGTEIEAEPATKPPLTPHPAVKTIWEQGSGPPPPNHAQADHHGTKRLIAAPPSKTLPPIVKLGKVPTKLVGTKLLPPPEYDHHYEGALKIVIVETFTELATFCGNVSSVACARRLDGGNRCLVYMIKEELLRARTGGTQEITLRHEIGHCNGWPGTHPDMRPLPP